MLDRPQSRAQRLSPLVPLQHAERQSRTCTCRPPSAALPRQRPAAAPPPRAGRRRTRPQPVPDLHGRDRCRPLPPRPGTRRLALAQLDALDLVDRTRARRLAAPPADLDHRRPPSSLGLCPPSAAAAAARHAALVREHPELDARQPGGAARRLAVRRVGSAARRAPPAGSERRGAVRRRVCGAARALGDAGRRRAVALLAPAPAAAVLLVAPARLPDGLHRVRSAAAAAAAAAVGGAVGPVALRFAVRAGSAAAAGSGRRLAERVQLSRPAASRALTAFPARTRLPHRRWVRGVCAHEARSGAAQRRRSFEARSRLWRRRSERRLAAAQSPPE